MLSEQVSCEDTGCQLACAHTWAPAVWRYAGAHGFFHGAGGFDLLENKSSAGDGRRQKSHQILPSFFPSVRPMPRKCESKAHGMGVARRDEDRKLDRRRSRGQQGTAACERRVTFVTQSNRDLISAGTCQRVHLHTLLHHEERGENISLKQFFSSSSFFVFVIFVLSGGDKLMTLHIIHYPGGFHRAPPNSCPPRTSEYDLTWK